MKILVYGSLNIDLTFVMDHIVKPGETQQSTEVRKAAGGKGANQAAAVAKASGGRIPVFFAGKIGSDGEFALKKLRAFGVDTSYVNHTETGTGQAVIQLDKDGQNSIILFGGGNIENTREEMDGVLDNFGEGDCLVINAEMNNLDYLFERALSKNMWICVNPSPITEALLSLPIEKASLLVLNEIEGAALANLSADAPHEEILKALAEKYPRSEIVLTVGKNGAYYRFKDTIEHLPCEKTTVVDTTCAGDTFLGYFLCERVLGRDARAALAFAGRASAVTVSRPGAMDSIPFREELSQLSSSASSSQRR